MALSITLTRTSTTRGSAPVEIPADVGKDLQDTYEALATESSRVWATAEFGTAEEARLFVRQARAWAAGNSKRFSRNGTVRDNPTVVQFRLYDPTGRPGGPGRKAAK